MTSKKCNLTWANLKRNLGEIEPAERIELIKDKYAVKRVSQSFRHAQLAILPRGEAQ